MVWRGNFVSNPCPRKDLHLVVVYADFPARIATGVRTKHDNELLTLGRAVGDAMYMAMSAGGCC